MRESVVARCQIIASPGRATSHAPAIGFLLCWLLGNLLYLAFACPHDLAPDEAHYWHWSRHLDWSYYSKGPLVAWLIRASCELFGDTAFAVRIPAALAGTALLAGLYVLVCDVLNDRRLALGTMLCAASHPGITAGSTLMTIDPPFLACWCGALVAVNRKWWLAAGAFTALGILAKYPMLLLPAILLLRGTPHRYFAIASLGCIPILIWNANHDWVSFHHVFAQAGVNPDRPAGWLSPLMHVGGQFGFLLGFWFVAFVAGAWRFRSDTRLSLMWWASVPVWCVFFAASLRTPGQVNWPAASYIGGAVLAAAWIRDWWHVRAVRIGLWIAVGLGASYSIGIRFPQIFRPMIAAMLPSPTQENPTPIRKLDVTARLAGWRTLANEVDRLRQANPDAVFAGMTWTIPGELSFHCSGHPEVYSFGSVLADRRSQYDLWRPNPVHDPENFRGRTFIYVGERIPEFDVIFKRVEEPIRITHFVSGVPLATWTVWVCHGFRGFPRDGNEADY
jgi:4-amino-4-deoxy-L-arabinose transferase-like glycosyltransferase